MSIIATQKNKKNGFVALISAVIISVLLLIITVGVSMTGIMGRFNVLDAESKERSISLAEACADTAILNFSQAFSPPSTVTAGSDTCSIFPVVSDTPIPGQTTIKTQAIINNAYTNLTVVVDSDEYNIISWEEKETF